MAKNTLILRELESTLRHWEDVNIYSEANFQQTLRGKQVRLDGYKKPIQGSEVDDFRILRRSIKNFRGFRGVVENYLEVDSNQFLPRVPTEQRERYSQLNFLRSGPRSVSIFPYFLLEWMKYKKVFTVESQKLIPVIWPEKKNYFEFLPFGSFIIKFNKPLVINMKHEGEESWLDYSYAIVVLDEETAILDVMFVDARVGERFIMSESERSTFEKIIREKNFKPKGEYQFHTEYGAHFPGVSIDVAAGEMVTEIWLEDHSDYGKGERIGTYDFENPEHHELGKYYKDLMGIINGFCKVISELPPRDSITEEEPAGSHPVHHEPFAWHSVPVSQIRELGLVSSPAAYVITGGSGGDKCYHWRQAHWRRIKMDDGTIYRKWIGPAEIRVDKKGEENLQGGATVLKSKKK